jgi:hypothetical protein
VTLLRLAADAARELADQGVTPQGAGPDIAALIAEQIFGSADSPSPADRPYRWPGAAANAPQPGPAFNQEFASLPPEQLYATGRLVRSAWDTLRRTIRETELPFDLNNTNFRDLAETVRALNELITTVTTNPDAREMAMAFLNRQQNNQAQADKTERSTLFRDLRPTPAPADADSAYREIPLRRRGAPSSVESPSTSKPDQNSFNAAGIPLRRRGQSTRPQTTANRQPSALSGSGDADKK